MDASAYLKRIQIDNIPNPDYESLRSIHRAHLMKIPFENLSIHQNEVIELDVEKLFRKIVENKRGGFCYELNGLFFSLLCSLGYNARRISARVFNEEGIPGPDFDHMAIIVKIDSDEYLCDVGFGDSFIEPLELKINKQQKQGNYIYQISEAADNELLLSRTSDKINWEKQYLLTTGGKELHEYNLMCGYHQSSPDSPFTKKKVCTIARENGRITLRENRLIITERSHKREIKFTGEEKFRKYLSELFDITIPHNE